MEALFYTLGTIVLALYLGSIGLMFFLAFNMIKGLSELHKQVLEEEGE